MHKQKVRTVSRNRLEKITVFIPYVCAASVAVVIGEHIQIFVIQILLYSQSSVTCCSMTVFLPAFVIGE